MSWLRFASAGVVLVAAALLVSCTGAPARAPVGGRGTPASARPWWPHGKASISTCEGAALVRAHGRVLGVGTCEGLLDRTDGCRLLHHLRGREVSRTCPVAVVTVVP